MKNILICYVPVLHDGYRELFQKYAQIHEKTEKNSENELWILGDEFVNEFPEIKKDARRIGAELVKRSVEAWNFFAKTKVVSFEELKNCDLESAEIQVVMSNDEMMRQIASRFFPDVKINYEPIFLRWDKHNALTEKEVSVGEKMSFEDFDQKIMKLAFTEATKSTDWWRHVGGAVVKDGEIILVGFNKHLPSENTHHFNNDVRSLFSKGKYFELSSSIHAEAKIIAEAAKKGISLEGSSMYVTTFPCPICAKQIAETGIKKLYYCGGYTLLDGEDIMKARGIELVKVELDEKDQLEIVKLEEERSIIRKY